MANVWTTKGATDVEHEVDPISRIEGHLGVKVTVDTNGVITDANAHGNLWRGFENFLLGRDINDAITFVQRICGVCPVPHGMTSTYAVDNVLGYSKGHITFKTATETDGTWGVPAKAVLIRNLVAACDSIMSSLTHFYHLAAPSYVQGPAIPPWTPYFDNNYYSTYLRNPGWNAATQSGGTAVPDLADPALWDAVILSYVKALRARRLVFEAGSLFAGRMPMTSCYVGGGVTNDHTENLSDRITRFTTLMTEVGRFVVNEYIPIALALGALYPDFDSQDDVLGGVAIDGIPRGFGAGLGRFLAWGAYPMLADDSLASAGGVFDATTGTPTTPASYDALNENALSFRVLNKQDVYDKFLAGGTFSVPDNLTEDIAHSRYVVDNERDAAAYAAGVHDFTSASAAYPGDVSRTKPNRANGYTFMKAPRWAGKACEVGPLARLAVAGLYPVDGRKLADVFPGYGTYAATASDPLDPLGTGLRTGIVAEAIVAGLIKDGLAGTVAGFILGLKGGLSTLDRLRARALETLYLVQKVLGPVGLNAAGATPAERVVFAGGGWLTELAAEGTSASWRELPLTTGEHQGWGAHEAARGALMHQATIKAGKILKYQAIVPTTWNGSPKNAAGDHGAIEKAMLGATFFLDAGTGTEKGGGVYKNQAGGVVTTEGGVEVLRIAQSFDPCIACAIH